MGTERMRFRRVALPLISLTLATSAEGAEIRLESGADLDTNAAREEYRETSDGLVRAVADLAATTPFGQGGRLQVNWQGGGKKYFTLSGEDVLHQRAELSLSQAVAQILSLRLDAAARDRTSRAPVSSQDHTRVQGGPGLDVQLGDLTLGLRGGYERFVFKPDPDFDSDAASGTALAAYGFDALTLQLTGTMAHRRFTGTPLTTSGHDAYGKPIFAEAEGRRRAEDYLRIGAGAQYGDTWLLAIDAAYETNTSNSVGATYDRQSVRVQGTVPLPWELLLTAALALQWFQYPDRIYLSNTLFIEDEGRSAVTLRVERPLDDDWSLVGSGGGWFKPGGTGPDYRRVVAGLGVAYRLEP